MTAKSWINVVLGLWLVVSGLILPQRSGVAVTDDIVTGLFIALFALWAARAYRPYVSLVASWAVMLTGAWTAVAPFVLAFDRPTAGVVNDVVVGLAVFLLGIMNTVVKARQYSA